jgi:beta-glucosidase
MTDAPLYPFGFGLSYTQFAYSDLTLHAAQIAAGDTLRVRCTLSNTGQFEAEEVAQCYVSDTEASVLVPLHKLVAFQRVRLTPGEQCSLEFTITPEMLELIDEEGQSRLELGQFRVTVGSCSPGSRGVALGAPELVSATVTVV